MRVVRSDEDLSIAFGEARSEAFKAFGDDTVFLEKLIEAPKHIEVQVLGDKQGNLVHLYERDCSVQRRFQKVVEIAPSCGLKEETRQALFDYALAITRQVGYYNAGTVEFLVDNEENIYFIEVNPRIQVEHTVTEQVTGIDIVRSQIQIADGYRLDDPEISIKSQESIRCTGYAVQCRITTEDPEKGFQPDYGTMIAYRSAAGFGIRLDVGAAYTGARVSPFFDSLLVKVTAQGRTLKGAVQRGQRALREFRIRGVKTNIGFLENVLEHPTFNTGKATVSFIDDHPELFQITQSFDRATKTLKYIAKLTVNGNPDVGRIEPGRVFRKAVVPPLNRLAEYPRGTKHLLDEMGPEAFCAGLKSASTSCIPIRPSATLTSPCWRPGCAPWTCWRWPRVSPRRTHNCSPWKCGVGQLSTLRCASCGNARGTGCSNYAKQYPISCFRCCSGVPMRWDTKRTRTV